MVNKDSSSVLLFFVGALLIPVKCCEKPFISVSGKCLYFGIEQSMTHFESFELCAFLQGQLARIESATQLMEIVQYIQANDDLALTYWLGGTDEYKEDTWLYAYGEPVPRGTPFWATIETDSFNWDQLPEYNETKNCLSMNEELHYYFTDEDCEEFYNPICEKEPTSAREQCDGVLDYPDKSEIEQSYDGTIKDQVGSYGQVSCPNYLLDLCYQLYLDVTITWTVSIDARVDTDESFLTVYFDHFDLYSMAYLTIRDGPNESSALIGTYNQTYAYHQTVNSTGSQLYFSLYMDNAAFDFRGFLFTWKAENIQCEENSVGTNGMISSVNYEGHYLRNIDCEWTIQSPPEITMPNTIIQITILQFDTQPENDFLEIRDVNSTGPIIANISGHSWPLDVISSTGSQIHIKFHSDDDQISFTGFELQWHAVVCPEPYIVIGKLCVHFTLEDFTWGEAYVACKQIHGHLARINDPEHLRTIYSYLQETNIDQDSFWIDGKGNMEDGSWLWQDNSSVPTGTPFWGLTYDGTIQEPDNQGDENCLVLLGEGFHYFRDADCNQDYKSICMTDVVKY